MFCIVKPHKKFFFSMINYIFRDNGTLFCTPQWNVKSSQDKSELK